MNLDLISKLPVRCAAHHPTENGPIMIRRGETGYYPAPWWLNVDAYNSARGITGAQVEAMLIGSCFGWDVPGANPDMHR
jgi:hypothetical protein